MKFSEMQLKGAFIIDLDPIEDERGFFARAWCQQEFAQHALNSRLVQCNLSYCPERGTLRGLHYQVPPHAETKLVRCIRGIIYDVIVDLRSNSPTYKRWTLVELSAANRSMLYVPEGFAHGFQTLEDGTEVFYQVSEFYHPESERGIRWDDPAFNITWPVSTKIISKKDQAIPFFNDEPFLTTMPHDEL